MFDANTTKDKKKKLKIGSERRKLRFGVSHRSTTDVGKPGKKRQPDTGSDKK